MKRASIYTQRALGEKCFKMQLDFERLSINTHLCGLFNFQKKRVQVIGFCSQHLHLLSRAHLETGFRSSGFQLFQLLLKVRDL